MSGKKKIMILVANPVKHSFSYACGDAYEQEARENGAEVKRFNINDMDFDPTLHNGYETIQELEPDLVSFQETITWADHLVFIYPNWWSTMPAKMKGLFDRSFLPRFAFSFKDNTFTPLLKKKSARIINIVGSLNPLVLRLSIGSYTNELANGILKTCGIRPVYITSFGATRNASPKRCAAWLKRVRRMAKQDTR